MCQREKVCVCEGERDIETEVVSVCVREREIESKMCLCENSQSERVRVSDRKECVCV